MPYVRSGEHDVWWDSAGAGSALLLINGISSPSDTWFRLVPVLAERHRVIRFDNLGVGRTGVPSAPWTMADMAQAAADVLAYAGVTSAAVLGISMGGMIAQELAHTRPELVSRLVLVATHPGVAHASGDPAAGQVIMSAGDLPSEQRIAALNGVVYHPSTPADLIAEDTAVRTANPTSEAGYAGQLAAALPWDGLPRLGEVGCPTLVLHGREDRLVDVSCGHALVERIPGARLAVLADCGHQLFTDQLANGAQAVLDFLSGPGTPGK